MLPTSALINSSGMVSHPISAMPWLEHFQYRNHLLHLFGGGRQQFVDAATLTKFTMYRLPYLSIMVWSPTFPKDLEHQHGYDDSSCRLCCFIWMAPMDLQVEAQYDRATTISSPDWHRKNIDSFIPESQPLESSMKSRAAYDLLIAERSWEL